jgi:hypothetical protein
VEIEVEEGKEMILPPPSPLSNLHGNHIFTDSLHNPDALMTQSAPISTIMHVCSAETGMRDADEDFEVTEGTGGGFGEDFSRGGAG